MSNDNVERKFPRRLLLASSGAAAAVGVTQVIASPAEAAPPGTAWQLGGNAKVATNGTNFLGVKNVAPLIFKTSPTPGNLMERMRLTETGRLGIGTTAPNARLDVASDGTNPSIHAKNTNTNNSTKAIHGVCDEGYGVYGESANAYGVSGNGGYNGVFGTGGSYGGIFESPSGTGAYGSGGAYGVYGSGGTRGVYGSGSSYGVQGGGGTYGVYGTGTSSGVYGSGPTGVTGSGTTIGVFGGGGNATGSAGCRGNSGYVGVWGTGNIWGVYGITTVTTGQIYGVYGATDSPAGFGVWSDGNCHVTGTLSKAAGSFKIDHPLAPDTKWLSHSFVESPDMMNVYNGNITTGATGTATVKLPNYFHALNKDFRYQLTVIGDFAQAVVSRKVKNGSFQIKTDKPNVEVSWQVTGIRHDDYARENPIKVETNKTKAERGTRQFVPAGSNAKKMRVGPHAA